MKERSGDPWMPADVYGRSLVGFGVNLLVRNVDRAIAFQREVLGVELVYGDPDFAVCSYGSHQWMLHADHTYGEHPLLGLIGDGALRGAGAELRLYGIDPDQAEARARARDDHIMAPAQDKPHGLRECFIADPDGYIWVPGIALPC